MYSIAIAEAPASDEIWWAFAALRLLDDAAEALAAAELPCRDAAEDAAWHNRGTSAETMRKAVQRLHDSLTTEIAAVRNAREQVRAGVGA